MTTTAIAARARLHARASSRPSAARDIGRTVAKLLAGSWRALPPALPASTAKTGRWLRSAEPRLLASGCGALVWHRLRHEAAHRELPEAQVYRDAFRSHLLRDMVTRERLGVAVETLRAEGIEPLLLKGWATSRLYPVPGVRPSGDLDLLVPPEQHADAARLLAAAPALATTALDLHGAIHDLADRPLAALVARSRLVDIGGVQLRVLGAEDHFRHLTLHFLRHGAWRPLWLCDIGLLLETMPAGFDWELCLAGEPRLRERVVVAAVLARSLLGAALPVGSPLEAAGDDLQPWVERATLRQWGRSYERYTGTGLRESWRRPRALWHAIHTRWPTPIEATVSQGASFGGGGRRRLSLQLTDVMRRTVSAATASRR